MSHQGESDRGGGIYAEARAWFEQSWDPNLPLREWWQRLADTGWGFPTWPVELYGRGLSGDAGRMVADARRDARVAPPPAGIAQSLAGPTIVAHGTPEQQARFLPGIVTGEIWCQLFSEPGAGSDLAGLQTRAERDGDEWVVNGQKVWTSGAHIARYGILIARTDSSVPKHAGLTYFVIEMDQPGIEVRPIREMTGRAIFNEVFLSDARVPAENRIGGLGEGWAVAQTTLANERTMLGAGSFGSSGSGAAFREIDLDAPAGQLVRDEPRAEGRSRGGAAELMAAVLERFGGSDDPVVRQEVARIHSLIEIARYTDLRAKAAIERGGRPGPEVSVGKLAASQLLQTLRETLFRLCGPHATLWGDDAPFGGRVHEVGLSSYLISIGGGTDQIQRNIIGERVLGLPREPRADKDVPFRDLPVGTRARTADHSAVHPTTQERPMRSEALENIVTMLRTQAAERGDAQMTVAEWREAYDGLGALLPAADGVPVEEVDAGGVPAEWIGTGDGPVVVYVHGGGYCIGSLDSHRSMLTHLASAVAGRVLAVDYRLAPEHPFPAALDDACAAYRWIVAGGADPARVVVAGDSAGGGLTLATLVALRDAGDPLPAAGVCLSPWADLTQSGATMSEKADADPMVHAEDLGRWAAAYAGSDHDPGSPGLSPVFADLSGLPPLLVEVGTAEVLLDDARRLSERARGAGVDVTLFEGEDLIHVWHFFAGAVPEADDGIARVARFIAEQVR